MARVRSLVALIGVGIALVTTLGCRKSVAPACRQVCACSPCTGADLDTCVEKAEAAQASAEKSSCGDEFEAFVGCFEDTASCGDGNLVMTHRCTRVEETLKVCADAGNPFASVCDEALAKVGTCTGVPPQPQTSPCTGVTACTLACVLAAECDVLLGFRFDQDFADCTNACTGTMSPPKPP